MKAINLQQTALFCLLTLASGWASSQAGHGAHMQAADSTGIAAKTETTPENDAVLGVAPGQVDLVFPVRVRLVKLALYNEKRDWLDIDFRYNPRSNDSYSWQLPQLPEAEYYTADWAILSEDEQLVRGSFSFAFGPGAEPPSVTKEAAALLLEMHSEASDDVRYVAPPRTEIIINNQDEPDFDPPFTINLDNN